MADYKVPILAGTELSAGDLLRWTGSAWENYADSAYQGAGAILDDLVALGAPASDGQIIVATGAGAFAFESTTVARASLGIGEADSPILAGLGLTHATSSKLTFTWTTTAGKGEFECMENATFVGAFGSYGSTYADAPVRNSIGLTSGIDDTGFIFFRTKTGEAYVDRLLIQNDGTLDPGADAAQDLGSVGETDYRWRHLYLSGNLSDETNTLTIANCKTAYDHSQAGSGNPHSVTPTELGLVIDTDVQAHGDILDDLNTLGAPASDGQIIVATGAGAFAFESGDTARHSLGLGTGDSPTFAGGILNGDLVFTGTGGFNPTLSSNSSARLYVDVMGGDILTSSLVQRNTNTGSSAGCGILWAAGSTTSFIGGVSVTRTDASSNSLVALRVLSNSSLTSGDGTAPFYILGSATGPKVYMVSMESSGTVRANTAFNLNGTDVITASLANLPNTYPQADNTYYLGKNDDDTPFAWKGIILKDQGGTGKYYRLEVNGDELQIVDLTD